MELSDKPIANPLIILREEFDDWALLYNPDSTEALGINPIGVMLWKRLDGYASVAQLIDHVRENYSGVPASVEAEILTFLADLDQRGFVGFLAEQAV